MPQEEGGLKGIYYGISDRAWSLAEWTESKGIPIASFCEKYHLNPILLFGIILLAIILLVVLAMGALGGVSYGELSVTVTSGNSVLDGAEVYYTISGEQIRNVTDARGKVTIKFPMNQEWELYAVKEGYNAKSKTILLEEESGTATIDIERKVGELLVNVNTAGGKSLPSGSYVVAEAPDVNWQQQKTVINGQAKFTDVPAGAEVSVYVRIGDLRIPLNGQQVTINEGVSNPVNINVPDSALTVSLDVSVKDSLYQNVDNAQVQLFNWDTGMPIGDPETTYGGSATFNDVVMGTKIYATVYPSNSDYSSYNGKSDNKPLIVERDSMSYEITLQIIGRVEVCVYDNLGMPLNTGNIALKSAAGTSYATRTVDEACEEFSGLPEGVSIYPEVNVIGYTKYGSSSVAKTIDYSTITRFNVNMEELADGEAVQVYVHVSDCDGDAVSGIKIKIIDADSMTVIDEQRTECTGSATVTIPSCGNAKTSIASGREIYAVAFDDDYQIGRSGIEIAYAGAVLDIVTCEADDDNSGNLEACVYKNQKEFEGADLELYDSNGNLLWTANTEDDEDEDDHCYTFLNIPDGTTVYARAINIGTTPEVSGTVEIRGGSTANVTIYSGSPPVILDEGDVNICVKDESTNLSLVANVTVYDYITDQVIIAGETAGGGCRLFEDLVAETNTGGQVIDREIYVVVESVGYATYDGREEGDVLDMVANGQLDIDVLLPESYEVCVQARAYDDNSAMEVKVIMYYNESAEVPIKSVNTDGNGTALFYQAMKDTYYFKVEEDYTLYEPLDIYEFDREDVSEGECGLIEIWDLGSLCELGIETLDGGDEIRVIAGQDAGIPLSVLLDGESGLNSIMGEGSYANTNEIILDNGDQANITVRLNNDYQQFKLGYGYTEYSANQELMITFQTDEDDIGVYSGLIHVQQNELCERQADFDLAIYEEELHVTYDSISWDPNEDNTISFCIYVTDENEDELDDASVKVSVDEMDDWASTSSRTATYDETKECYKGALTESMAPEDDGTYLFYITTKRGDVTVITEAEALISWSDLCGNGEVDSGEECDTAEDESSCSDDETCNSDCECEDAYADGSLSVSADSATVNIGSGSGGGFCVYVSESDGSTNEDASVTANYYSSEGWPSDTSASASYSDARGCYYFSVSESLVWPTSGVTESNYNTYMASKTVYVSATDGDRSGSTSTSVSITCTCDSESWCEASCTCDEDCYDGSGATSLNLAGCLQLASANGYNPSGSTGYSSTRSGYSTGGQTYNSQNYNSGSTLNLGSGSIGIGGQGGYFGLDWDACKDLFGWGDGDEDGSGVGAYVLVKDYTGILKSKEGEFTAGNCGKLSAHLKKSNNFNYVYVQDMTKAAGQSDYCCTPNLEYRGWGERCSFDRFESLVESALDTENGYTTIDIIDYSKHSLSKYGLENDYQVFSLNDIGYSVYAKTAAGQKLFTPSVVFAAPATKVNNQNVNNQLVWAAFETGQENFDTLLSVWSKASLGGGRSSKGSSAEYPQGVIAAHKKIVMAPSDARSTIFAKYTEIGSLITGEEKSGGTPMSDSMFKNLGLGTTVDVIAEYNNIKTGNSVLAKVINYVDGGNHPKFEEVDGEDLSYCTDGTFKNDVFGDAIILRANPSAYIVSTAYAGSKGITENRGNVCTLDTTGKKISKLDKFTAESIKDIAYGKEKDGIQILLLDRDNSLEQFISDFLENRPGNDESVIYPYVGQTSGIKYYGIIRTECHEKQDCQLDSKNTWENIFSGISTDNFPEGYDEEDRIIDCVCSGEGTNSHAVRFTIDMSAVSGISSTSADGVTLNDMKLFILTDQGSGIVEKRLSSLSEASCSKSAKTCTVKVTDIPLDEGNIEVVASFERDGVGCFATPFPPTTDQTLDPDEISKVPVYEKTLTMAAGAGCFNGGASGDFTISGKVVDASGGATKGLGVKDADIRFFTQKTCVGTQKNNGVTTSTADGSFEGTVTYNAGQLLYAKAFYGGGAGYSNCVVTGHLSATSSGGSGNRWTVNTNTQNVVGSADVTANLKMANVYKLAFSGILKDRSGNDITKSQRVSISNANEVTAYGTGSFILSGTFVASPALLKFLAAGQPTTNAAGDTEMGIQFASNAAPTGVGFNLGSSKTYTKPGTQEQYSEYSGIELRTGSADGSATTTTISVTDLNGIVAALKNTQATGTMQFSSVGTKSLTTVDQIKQQLLDNLGNVGTSEARQEVVDGILSRVRINLVEYTGTGSADNAYLYFYVGSLGGNNRIKIEYGDNELDSSSNPLQLTFPAGGSTVSIRVALKFKATTDQNCNNGKGPCSFQATIILI